MTVLSARRWLIGVAAYSVLSCACLSAPHIPAIKRLVGYGWNVVWLGGPPVLLLHQAGYMIPYVLGTALIVIGVIVARALATRHPEVSILIGIGCAIIWVALGLLVYVPYW